MRPSSSTIITPTLSSPPVSEAPGGGFCVKGGRSRGFYELACTFGCSVFYSPHIPRMIGFMLLLYTIVTMRHVIEHAMSSKPQYHHLVRTAGDDALESRSQLHHHHHDGEHHDGHGFFEAEWSRLALENVYSAMVAVERARHDRLRDRLGDHHEAAIELMRLRGSSSQAHVGVILPVMCSTAHGAGSRVIKVASEVFAAGGGSGVRSPRDAASPHGADREAAAGLLRGDRA